DALMAENQNGTGDKSEKPTPQKLRKTREQGQVVRSRDLATAIGILVTLRLVVLLVPEYLEDFRRLFHQGFALLGSEGALENVWSATFALASVLLLKMIAPLLVVPLASVLGGLDRK